MVAKKKKTESRSRIRVTDRDVVILRDHVARFRMTTYEVLNRLYWPEGKIDAAKSWVRRMRRRGLLAAAPLHDGFHYYHLTPAGAKLIEAPPQAGRPQKPGYIVPTYGSLAFCCLAEQLRRKLSPQEFLAQFDALWIDREVNDTYYVDRTLHLHKQVEERARLGYIFVDEGRSLRSIPDRVRRIISKRLANSAWKNDIIRRGSFVVAVATTTPGKQARIEEAVRGIHPDVHVYIEVTRALAEVVTERSPRYAAER